MSGKTFFKKILYFLGIEDEVSQEHEKDNFEPYVARPESKPIGRVINIHQTSKNKMVIFKPDSFEEVREISDEVKNRRAAIVNLEKLDRENAKRVLDFMAGSIYALNGAVKKVGPGIFLFVPDNIDVSGVDIEEENQDKSSLASK
ncbi:MAG TPA: cell division protein SepF [Thermoanaerobacterales bacterium]|jgi:cell division inhibitor SepF|nr:cell division protein SepF [Thermoanaerobacterales bacterium]